MNIKALIRKYLIQRRRGIKVLILSIVTNIKETNCQRRIRNAEKSSAITILAKEKYFS